MDSEYLELKALLLEIKQGLNLLLPKQIPLNFITTQTGKSRQSITAFIKANYQQGVDFWLQNGKIVLS